MSVQGLEVNQAIYYYRANQHLTQVADQDPENSVRLVAKKVVYVRTYLRSGQDLSSDDGNLPEITGTLKVERLIGATATPEDSTYPVYLEFFLANDNCQSKQVTLNFYLSG